MHYVHTDPRESFIEFTFISPCIILKKTKNKNQNNSCIFVYAEIFISRLSWIQTTCLVLALPINQTKTEGILNMVHYPNNYSVVFRHPVIIARVVKIYTFN